MRSSIASHGITPSATQTTYRTLHRMIVTGELKPGEKLKIDRLRARLDIGTSPIREALSLLTSDNLVERIDQRAFVRHRSACTISRKSWRCVARWTLERAGQLAFAGPMSDETGERMLGTGLIVYRAETMDAARALADADPMHESGARTYVLRRWMINEGSLTLSVGLSTGGTTLA